MMDKLGGDAFSGIRHRVAKEYRKNHSRESVPNLRDAAKDVIERFIVALEKRDTKIAELEKALIEAAEWNWLDEDAGREIPQWLQDTVDKVAAKIKAEVCDE